MELNSYSATIERRLLTEFPELEDSVKPEQPAGCLLIEHPSPHADVSLFISTEDDEITIGLDGWHGHMYVGGDDAEEYEIANAIDLIRSILTDQVVVVFKTKHGRWIGSSLIRVDEQVSLEEGVEIRLSRWTRVSTARG